jgi:CRP-like cAMP-binding protein
MEGGVNMIVKETDLFKGLSVEILEKIASQCEEMRFKPQEVIFKSGEKGGGIYILEEGKWTYSFQALPEGVFTLS